MWKRQRETERERGRGRGREREQKRDCVRVALGVHVSCESSLAELLAASIFDMLTNGLSSDFLVGGECVSCDSSLIEPLATSIFDMHIHIC